MIKNNHADWYKLSTDYFLCRFLHFLLHEFDAAKSELSLARIYVFFIHMDMYAITGFSNTTTLTVNRIVNFILKYQIASKDELENIFRSVDYALSPYKYQGGFVLLAEDNHSIIGSVVVNRTNMEGYVPRNLMVYFAADPNSAFPDIEKDLLKKAIQLTSGEIACHISVGSPEINLLEDVGFEKNFFEMRLKK